MTSADLEHVIGWGFVYVMGVIALGLSGAVALWKFWPGADR